MLSDVVATSSAVSSTRSRLAKVRSIATLLKQTSGPDTAIVVSYLSGVLPQRRAGVGWASLRDMPSPAAFPSLTVEEVDAGFTRIESASGAGSTTIRRVILSDLLSRATESEQKFLAALISGELRQGALAGIMIDAVVEASGLDPAPLRRAVMLAGNLPSVAAAALEGGAAALSRFHLRVGVPLHPMLAQSASSLEDALARSGPASVEWKLDGVRIQVHRHDGDVKVFTRTLDEITDRVPEVVQTVRSFPVASVILDGEAIALRPDGRPLPFQETGRRVATQGGVETVRGTTPLTPFFFDILHVDGVDLIDLPLSQRLGRASETIDKDLWVPRTSTDSTVEAQGFLDAAMAAGHEGVMVKSLDSLYEAGRRGACWIKVKPHDTLDLVILAAEWGHGRRSGWLSNLHVGALDPDSGQFVMLGKTFKGLTDTMLKWQTKRLQELETRRDQWTVYVRPELVVEIAFNGLQASPRYPGGMALRFARVVRYREDKPAAQADTISRVHEIYARGGLDAHV